MLNKYYLSIDDFGFLLEGWDDLLRIKQHYPDFKITCFTIPISRLFFLPENVKHFKESKYKEWAKIINSHDWIEVAMHGFSHTLHEMERAYDSAEVLVTASEKWFGKMGLKYKKIFKAPFWQYSYDSLLLLRDRGYVVALDRNYPRGVPEGTKTYIYNWSFEEPLPQEEIIKGHGHAYSTPGVTNAIGDCYANIIKQIPAGAQFGFVSDLYGEG